MLHIQANNVSSITGIRLSYTLMLPTHNSSCSNNRHFRYWRALAAKKTKDASKIWGRSRWGIQHQTPQDSLYYEVLDKFIQGIQSRFDQPGYRIMANVEKRLIAAANGETVSIGNIDSVYYEEFDLELLETQLGMLKSLFPQTLSINTFSKFPEWFTFSDCRYMLSEVQKIIRLILVLPATNAISEQSFSTLRRV